MRTPTRRIESAVCLFFLAIGLAWPCATAAQSAPRKSAIAFIGNIDASTISVIDVTSGEFTAALPSCSAPGPVAMAPDQKHFYAFCYSGGIVSVDTQSLSAVIRSPGLSYINGIAVTPDNTQIYVTGGADDTVSIIDAATLQITASFSVPNDPPSGLDNHNGLVFNPSGTRLYVTQCGWGCYLSAVSVVDTSTRTVVAQIDLGATGPGQILSDQAGAFLYVMQQGAFGSGSTVSVIDTALNQVVASIPVGSGPYSAALNRVGDRLYVANYNDGTLSVIDTDTRTVMATIPVGRVPSGVSVTADGLRVLVTSPDDHAISIIDTVTNIRIATIAAEGAAYSAGSFITSEPLGARMSSTLSVSPSMGRYQGSALLSATLRTTAGPLAGQAVTFALGGSDVGTATTDAFGVATILATTSGFGVGTHARAIGARSAGLTVAPSFASGDLTITPSSALVYGPEPSRLPYSGRAQLAPVQIVGSAGESLGSGSLRYRRIGDEEWSDSGPVNAGDYEVEITFDGAGGYEPLQAIRSFAIDKVEPSLQVADVSLTYDGEPHPVLANAIGAIGEDVGPLLITYATDLGDPPVNAGVYDVVVDFTGSENYLPTGATAHVTIQRATPVLTVRDSVVRYDGRSHPMPVSVIGARGESLVGATVEYIPGGRTAPVNARLYIAIATYAGDVNHEAVSGEARIEIVRATPSILIEGGTFAYDGAPHGGVDGRAIGAMGEDLGPAPIDYSPGGTEPVGVGTYEATARFEGNANYIPWSATATIVIEPGAATVEVTGGTFMYDGHAHPAAGTVTGIAGESLGGLVLTYNGLPDPPINAGTYAVTANFQGDANYAPGSATTVVHITPLPLFVTVAPATKSYGQPNPPFIIELAGLIEGETSAVLRGVLTFSTDATAAAVAGIYAVTAGGVTAQNYLLSFIAGTLSVTQAGSTTTVTSSSNPAGYMQPIALRADIQIVPVGAGAPTGTVEFVDGTTPVGSANVIAGAATINVVLASGTHDITARYLGSSDVAASATAYQQVVNTRNDSTTTSLRIRPTQSRVGDTVTFDIDVSGHSGSITGVVELLDGNALAATIPLSGGAATYATSSLTAGSHVFTARYMGDAANTPSTSSPVVHAVADEVRLERSNINLSAKQARVGQSIPVDVIVSGTGSAPVGSVQLYVDGGLVATLPLTVSGARTAMASTQLAPLPAGNHVLTAVYSGSTTHAGTTGQVQLKVR